MNQFRNYIEQIWQGISSTKKGMSLTWKHLWAAKNQRKVQDIRSDNYFQSNEGVFTLQYPAEQVEIPERSRYQLDNVMEDCIVCDKCVKICPVDCIDLLALNRPNYKTQQARQRYYAKKQRLELKQDQTNLIKNISLASEQTAYIQAAIRRAKEKKQRLQIET